MATTDPNATNPPREQPGFEVQFIDPMARLTDTITALTINWLDNTNRFTRWGYYTLTPSSDKLFLQNTTNEDLPNYLELDAPPLGKPWYKLDFLLSQTTTASSGIEGEDEQLGIMQIGINFPLLEGDLFVYTIYDDIRRWYSGGRYISYAGTDVMILRCSMKEPTRVDAQIRGIVSIDWRVRLVRTDPTVSQIVYNPYIPK